MTTPTRFVFSLVILGLAAGWIAETVTLSDSIVWLLAFTIAARIGWPRGETDAARRREEAKAKTRRAEALELREWARIIDAEDFDPAELPPGAIVASLRGAANALDAEGVHP